MHGSSAWQRRAAAAYGSRPHSNGVWQKRVALVACVGTFERSDSNGGARAPRSDTHIGLGAGRRAEHEAPRGWEVGPVGAQPREHLEVDGRDHDALKAAGRNE